MPLFCLHPPHHVVFVFLMTDVFIAMTWTLTVVFIWISILAHQPAVQMVSINELQPFVLRRRQDCWPRCPQGTSHKGLLLIREDKMTSYFSINDSTYSAIIPIVRDRWELVKMWACSRSPFFLNISSLLHYSVWIWYLLSSNLGDLCVTM